MALIAAFDESVVVNEPLDGLPHIEVRDPDRNRIEVRASGGLEPSMTRYRS